MHFTRIFNKKSAENTSHHPDKGLNLDANNRYKDHYMCVAKCLQKHIIMQNLLVRDKKP